MIRRLVATCSLSFSLLASLAAAQEKTPEALPPPIEKEAPKESPKETDAPVGAAPSCAPSIDCCLPVHRIQIAEEQQLIALPRFNVREEVTKVPFVGVDIEYKEEKRSITVMVPKVRKEERCVSSVSIVPETTIDPCTGCATTTCKEVPITKTVIVETIEVVPETRTYVVRVPVLKPVEKLAVVKRVVLDCVTVPAMETRFKAVESKADVKVSLPVCQPSCCPAPCEPACPDASH